MTNNLYNLLYRSTSTRTFFVTLPVWLQLVLHEDFSHISTAAQLHHISGILLEQQHLV